MDCKHHTTEVVCGCTHATPPASLVSEVLESLLEAGPGELRDLLTVFVKASCTHALQAVRGAAVQRGVLVPVKPSRYQQCSHAMLNSLFSFLSEGDLRVVDAVCRRWRSATWYSNAGWLFAMSDPDEWADKYWLQTMKKRRIRPAQLVNAHKFSVTSAANKGGLEPLAAVGQIPSLTDLTCYEAPVSVDFLRLIRQPALCSLRIYCDFLVTVSLNVIETLLSAPFAETLKLLDWDVETDCHQFIQLLALPVLESLDVVIDEWSSLTKPVRFTALTSLGVSLGNKIKEDGQTSRFLTDLQLPNLRSLILRDAQLGEQTFGALAAMTNLTSLEFRLRHMQESNLNHIYLLSSVGGLKHLHFDVISEQDLVNVCRLTQLESIGFCFKNHYPYDDEKRDWKRSLGPLHFLPRLHTVAGLPVKALHALPAGIRTLWLWLNRDDIDQVTAPLRDHTVLPALQTLRTRSTMSEELQRRLQQIRPQLIVKDGLDRRPDVS